MILGTIVNYTGTNQGLEYICKIVLQENIFRVSNNKITNGVLKYKVCQLEPAYALALILFY